MRVRVQQEVRAAKLILVHRLALNPRVTIMRLLKSRVCVHILQFSISRGLLSI